MSSRTLAAVAALAAWVAMPAPAWGAGLRHAPAPERVVLPGEASAAAVRADPSTWIVGTRGDRTGAGRIARARGATRIAGTAWLAPRGRAAGLAAALRARGLLAWAEPNRLARRTQAPAPDPLSPQAAWRDRVVGAAVPPPVTPQSPLIGVVDTMIDVTHPEIAGSNIATAGGRAVADFHGTAVATVIAAPANGVGFLGIWPGARALNLPLPNGQAITCADSVRGIAAALKAGVSVINMSYGSASRCTAEARQVQRAIQRGVIPVAAAGNEFEAGNPPEFPASLPHVLTVSATDPADQATGFSNSSAAVDLAAPGIGILTAVPVGQDPDGNGDGFAGVAGTSFSAPMVSAAVAWIRAARPDLAPMQAAQAVRVSARDVAPAGYDNATGFGVLSIPNALALPAPAIDPFEPNDDLRDVNGRAFGSLAPPLSNGRPGKVTATADAAEDPIDVYRFKVRAGRKARVTLKPSVGDPDLFVFGAKARSVRSERVGVSTRSGRRTDRVTVRNRGRNTTTYYAAVGFSTRKQLKLLNAAYTLRAG